MATATPSATKYDAIAPRRPRRSATYGAIRQPMIVPTASIIEPYDAIRAASAVAYPSRTAIWVVAAGTYIDPAHSPTMETVKSSELTIVRCRYSGVKSAANALHRLGRSLTVAFPQVAGSRTPL